MTGRGALHYVGVAVLSRGVSGAFTESRREGEPLVVRCAGQACMLAAEMAEEGPTVPDWVGAVGTAAAFMLAAIIFVIAERDRKRRQASLVSAWVESAGDDSGRAVVHLVNGSGQPVYDVSLQAEKVIAEPLHYEVLPPEHREQIAAVADVASPLSTYGLGVTVRFTDASGRRWRRVAAEHHRLRRTRRTGRRDR